MTICFPALEAIPGIRACFTRRVAGLDVCVAREDALERLKPYHLRALADADKGVSPEEILRMATINGARALGLTGKIGELAKNGFADLIALPFTGKIARAPEAVLAHTGHVAASMIEGRWAIPPS